jgi:DNA-binding response OmpR family regulator
MEPLDQVQTAREPVVLVVDDDQDTCTLLKASLRAEGYTAKTVYRGEDAIAYVEKNDPDVVVLDIMMPGMDGWETFGKIRSCSNVPVLFLTAMGAGEFAQRALRLRGSDFMHKPFTRLELLARVEALMNNAKQKPARFVKDATSNGINREMGITVVIPAYNEARFIGSTVLRACEYANNVIVVDDGSRDPTAEIAEAAGAILVRHLCNQGKGVALNTGFEKAREMGAQVVVTLDADGQHLPEELAQVVKPVLAGEADIVIGSRYLKKACEVPRSRILGHWFFNKFTRLASGTASTDSQSGYRAFSHAALQAITFCSQGFSVESEMQFIAHEKSLRLVEVPITILYTDRPKRSVIGQGLSVLGGVFKIMGQYRPLFYFGLPGMISMFMGLLLALGVLIRYNETRQLAVGFSLVSILLTLVGAVLFSTGFTLHSIRGLLTDMLHLKRS